MVIPIQNIYYLLCYAWNKIDERDRVQISIDDRTTLLDLFAKVLIGVTQRLLKRGIDKNYVDHTEELAGVKGKIQISETLKRNILHRQRTVCAYDVFSANILPNQILVTTLYRLVNTHGLDKGLKGDLISLCRMLAGVDRIKINGSLFSQVKIHRNNRLYGFAMHICELIFDNMLPSEQPGKYSFADFTRDEKKMSTLFEAFVRNFYRIEQQKYNVVRRETIKWNFEADDLENMVYLPRMETDITLENDKEKMIIDAKYYRETMTLRYNKRKIHPDNLYQLFSYILNQETDSDKTKGITGMLLYPTVNADYDLSYRFKDHTIQVRTVNLNTDWKNISARLLQLIG